MKKSTHGRTPPRSTCDPPARVPFSTAMQRSRASFPAHAKSSPRSMRRSSARACAGARAARQGALFRGPVRLHWRTAIRADLQPALHRRSAAADAPVPGAKRVAARTLLPSLRCLHGADRPRAGRGGLRSHPAGRCAHRSLPSRMSRGRATPMRRSGLRSSPCCATPSLTGACSSPARGERRGNDGRPERARALCKARTDCTRGPSRKLAKTSRLVPGEMRRLSYRRGGREVQSPIRGLRLAAGAASGRAGHRRIDKELPDVLLCQYSTDSAMFQSDSGRELNAVEDFMPQSPVWKGAPFRQLL